MLVGRQLRGRERALGRLVSLIDDRGARVMSVTGLPGVGKSTLVDTAVASIAHEAGSVPVCVEVPDLAGATRDEVEAVLRHLVADAADLALGAGASMGELAAALQRSDRLIVLDQAHRHDAVAAFIADLSPMAPNVRWLVSVRRPLRVADEHVVRLAPLPVPDPDAPADVLAVNPAIQVFRDVAAAAGGWDSAYDRQLDEVATICRVLGGVPLAIEIVAARSPAFAPSDLRALLDEPATRSRWIGEAYAAAVDWSATLLPPAERDVLDAMAVFVGPVPVEAIEQVIGRDVVDDLADLVDSHLVSADHSTGAGRYVLPPLVAEHVRRLVAGSANGYADAHLNWALTAATEATSSARGETGLPDPGLAPIATDLVAAARHVLRSERPSRAAPLVIAVAPLWLGRGVRDGHVALATQAHESLGDHDEPAVRALMAGWLANLLAERLTGPHDLDRIVALRDEALDLARGCDELTLVRAIALAVRTVRIAPGAIDVAGLCEEGIELGTGLGDQGAVAQFEIWTGMIAHVTGDVNRAVTFGSRALGRARRAGDEVHLVAAAGLLRTLPNETAIDVPVPTARELIETARRIGDERTMSWVAPAAAAEAADHGDLELSAELTLESLERVRGAGSWVWHLVPPIVNLAVLAELNGENALAARFHGVVAPQIETFRPMAPLQMLARIEQSTDRLRHEMEPEVYRREFTAGSFLSFDAALVEAITAASSMLRSSPVELDPKLSDREMQVMEHLAAGDSNKDVAAHLGIRPKTVMHHTSSIYRKLDVRGRGEAVAWYFRSHPSDRRS